MKILHVVQSLSRKFGGITSVVLDLAAAQAQAGIDVTILTTNIASPSGEILDVPKNKYIRLGDVLVRYSSVDFYPILFSCDFTRELFRSIRQYDLVHIHSLYRYPLTISAWLSRSKSIPYVMSTHGALDPYSYARSTVGQLFLKRIYERLLDLPSLNHASSIHYTTLEEKKGCSPLGLKAPSFVVPNGINWEPFRYLPARGRFRQIHNLLDQPLILFLGRIHFKKGFDLLIPAFSLLKKIVPDAILVIVGPDNDNYGLEVRSLARDYGVQNSILFVGHLDIEDVVQAYVDADVFVLPSHAENFGVSVIEAMASGLPVIITNRVNIYQDIEASGAGIVVDCDVNNLSTAILKILSLSAEKKAKMGYLGRAYVYDHYLWSAVVKSMTSHYTRLISAQKNLSLHPS